MPEYHRSDRRAGYPNRAPIRSRRSRTQSDQSHGATPGATVAAEAAARDWGGYSGLFADPDGLRWEVAYNPPRPPGSSVP
jgi:hypothetical protein